MKKRIFAFLAIMALASAMPVLYTSCQSKVTLEQGGAYSDTVLAVTDQAILDASHTMTGFVQWAQTNKVYLERWPEVGNFAEKVALNKDGWIKNAYFARDAYAAASIAYKAAKLDAVGLEAKRAQLMAAIAVMANITTQISQYRSAHNA